MSYRIFMTVKRGILDKTAVCVFPWEKPILEEVHGAEAEEVTIDQMCSTKDVVNIQQQKMMHATTERPLDMRAQLEAMTRVHKDLDPVANPDGEWARLVNKYGNHLKVNLPNVEKVYGSMGAFRRTLAKYKGTKPVTLEFEQDTDIDAYQGDDKPIAEMSLRELRAKLDMDGIAYNKSDKLERLQELAEMASA